MRLRKRIPVPQVLERAWERWSMRERGLAVTAAAVVLFAGAWSWVWQPMQEDTMRIRRELVRDRAVLAVARAQSTEIAGLQRDAQRQPANDSRVAIERVLGERGLKAALSSLDIKDTRTTITFAAINFDALVGLLDTLAKADGLRPVEAAIVSRIEPGTVRAEIALSR